MYENNLLNMPLGNKKMLTRMIYMYNNVPFSLFWEGESMAAKVGM